MVAVSRCHRKLSSDSRSSLQGYSIESLPYPRLACLGYQDYLTSSKRPDSFETVISLPKTRLEISPFFSWTLSFFSNPTMWLGVVFICILGLLLTIPYTPIL